MQRRISSKAELANYNPSNVYTGVEFFSRSSEFEIFRVNSFVKNFNELDQNYNSMTGKYSN